MNPAAIAPGGGPPAPIPLAPPAPVIPAVAAAAAAAAPIVAATATPPLAPIAELDYDTVVTVIGVLPPLLPRPSHANIRVLERTLFERLEQLPSHQSEDWGFRGLAEQPAEYALKSATPWVDAPNPGPHRPIGLNAQLTRDAEATYEAEKRAYIAQATVTRAINAALNSAVPKQFKRGTMAAGGTLLGSTSYRTNHDPKAILLSLRDTYGTPSPAKRQANDAAFATPWNPTEPIEAYFDRLEDCFVAAVIAKPPYTLEQLITRAIMGIQLTGLYSQALIDWQALPTASHTWDTLKTHFTAAYVARIQSGQGTMAANGYHIAANAITTDDALSNIEQTFTNELSSLQLAHNTTHQATLAQLTQLAQQQKDLQLALHAAEARIAALTHGQPYTPGLPPISAPPGPPPYVPPPPTAPPAAPPGHHTPSRRYTRNTRRSNRPRATHNNSPDQGHLIPIPPGPNAAYTPHASSIPIPPSYTRNAPNPQKYYANNNYCFSCGYDVPRWHTSATCNNRKRGHQIGCNKHNVAQYEAMGHQCSRIGKHKTIMPTNPSPDQLT